MHQIRSSLLTLIIVKADRKHLTLRVAHEGHTCEVKVAVGAYVRYGRDLARAFSDLDGSATLCSCDGRFAWTCQFFPDGRIREEVTQNADRWERTADQSYLVGTLEQIGLYE